MKNIPHIRNLFVLRDTYGRQTASNGGLLRLMMSSEPFAEFVLDCIGDAAGSGKTTGVVAIPRQWSLPDITSRWVVVRYDHVIPCEHKVFFHKNSWMVISDGRFVTGIDSQRIRQTLADSNADMIAVSVVPQMSALYEKVLTTSNNELVGFRLFYEDAVRQAMTPDDWPHHFFIRASALDKLLAEAGLPLDFKKLLEMCYSKSLKMDSVNIGGSVLDLAEENDFLRLMCRKLSSSEWSCRYQRSGSQGGRNEHSVNIADSAKLFGKILLGRGVSIDENAIIVGPTILGSNVRIGRDAVVRASVVGPGVSVRAGELLEGKVFTDAPSVTKETSPKTGIADLCLASDDDRRNTARGNFRYWPKFSYVRFVKRIMDVAVSVVVLILFLPVMPLLMLAVKLTSPGPVFFKDIRQGLHGRPFKCLKFRTMKVGAAGMQDRLRVLNQVDGPQFMMADDPRLSAVGRFLRETYLDEIPQFLNVLLGQMSVVGPRPSPESENRLCPFWRDARLSVRPGITGLWQICRTRQPMKDFQEWIHYDIRYVRKLSLKLDLWICWKTAKKMVDKFISQF